MAFKSRQFQCTSCGAYETLCHWPDACSACGGSIFPVKWLPSDADASERSYPEDYEPLVTSASVLEGAAA